MGAYHQGDRNTDGITSENGEPGAGTENQAPIVSAQCPTSFPASWLVTEGHRVIRVTFDVLDRRVRCFPVFPGFCMIH